ncbi:hypothetical protein KIW84_021042 [Lathyrus oleraceus]|uniref:Uncharacterized protein n=1 Tax=Pisum sativum TaxID=3888 RepID=A0A9D4Y780_PEA|nr:hypothetical protein KIW84_021042 [Pisum sativum]
MQEDHKLEGSKTKLLIRTQAMKQTANKLSNAHQLQPGAHASYGVVANHDNNEIRRVQQFSVGQSKRSCDTRYLETLQSSLRNPSGVVPIYSMDQTEAEENTDSVHDQKAKSSERNQPDKRCASIQIFAAATLEPFESNKSCYVCPESPVLPEINTNCSKLKKNVANDHSQFKSKQTSDSHEPSNATLPGRVVLDAATIAGLNSFRLLHHTTT